MTDPLPDPPRDPTPDPTPNPTADSKSDPLSVSLHGLVERQAATTPGAIAITAPDAVWTYADLDRHADRVAAGLCERGVRPGDLVGMAVDRSAAAVAAILGILKRGCAYVPLDPAYPPDRLDLILRDCAPATVIHAGAPGRHDGVDIASLLDGPPQHERVLTGPEDPAYVIYTSGSTGTPKGVVIPHRGIVNRILWEGATYPTGPGDAVLLRTPLSFDISLWEVFTPLSTGARLVVADPLYRDDPRYLTGLIRDEGVTCLALVPSLLQTLLEEEPGLAACPSLREVFCGGETLPPALVRRFFATTGAGLHNMYGPTEYSIDATAWDCRPGDIGESVPIGHPLAGTRLYVLDEHGRPAPTGELYIAGLGLALGYLGREDLTRERFVPDPFEGGRMYRTGDLVRRRSDGALEFLGRADDQVKVRGFRVEPGEVERALLAVEGVRRAVVTAYGEGADAGLAAYVVAADTSTERLRSALAGRLPDYMVPSRIVPLDHIPTGPTGKIDRAALVRNGVNTAKRGSTGECHARRDGTHRETARQDGARQDGTRQERAHRDGAHRDGTRQDTTRRDEEEGVVAAAFAEVLGLEDVPPDGDFFALGGNSLQAVRLLNRLRKRAAPGLPLAVLMNRPTVAGIATAIREAGPR